MRGMTISIRQFLNWLPSNSVRSLHESLSSDDGIETERMMFNLMHPGKATPGSLGDIRRTSSAPYRTEASN